MLLLQQSSLDVDFQTAGIQLVPPVVVLFIAQVAVALQAGTNISRLNKARFYPTLFNLQLELELSLHNRVH